MTLLADLLSTVFDRRYRSGPAARDDSRPLPELASALVSASGETSGLALARSYLDRFEQLDDDAKLAVFHDLAEAKNIDPTQVRNTLAAYEADPSKATYRAFMAAAEPPRQELIRRLNQVPGATARLVRMRADLLRLGRGDPALQALDLDFRHLFASWFNRGFLVLRPINWESPAHILEKIIAYEAVHAIDSWDDLRRRLQPEDRRCFAFFHPAMPDEPLIFVEVALTRGIPGSIQMLLAEERDLSTELAGLKTFVTLSPIPGLMRWHAAQEAPPPIDTPEALRATAAHYLLKAKTEGAAPLDPVARFHLGNGAQVHAVHAGADTSDKGLAQSAGAMVNYLYDLGKVAQNHEKFATDQTVAASPEVRALAAGAARSQA